MANYSMPTNVTGFSDLFVWANDTVNQTLGAGLLFAFFIILFSYLKGHSETKEAMATSLYITTILAILFRILAVINDYIMFIFIIATAVAGIAHYLGER